MIKTSIVSGRSGEVNRGRISAEICSFFLNNLYFERLNNKKKRTYTN